MAKAKVPGSGDVARRLDKVEVAIIRLAKAQERTEERLTLLAESTERSIQQVTESVLLLAKGQERLVEGQERLIEAQRLTSEELIQLGKRMDSYGEQVLRGFTESTRRNGDVNAKVEALEKRIEALERAQ